MVRFADFPPKGEATEQKLTAYLLAHPEWVRLEFKKAEEPPVYGLRNSVAALASTEGGDLFVGVTDYGEIRGCTFDPSDLSKVLAQDGAESRKDVLTNLVPIAGEPKKIKLMNGNTVYWFDVPQSGWVVAALQADRSLALFDRPGANKDKLCGIAAVDLYLKVNHAKLLRRVLRETAIIEAAFAQVNHPESGKIDEDTIAAIRHLVESEEWYTLANDFERRWVHDEAYLALFLRLPAAYLVWEKSSGNTYQHALSEMLVFKQRLASAVKTIRHYLENERILPKE